MTMSSLFSLASVLLVTSPTPLLGFVVTPHTVTNNNNNNQVGSFDFFRRQGIANPKTSREQRTIACHHRSTPRSNHVLYSSTESNVVSPTPPQEEAAPPVQNTPYGVSKVRNIIAVSSCKGGVGKSTTAVNLAYTLSSMNKKVGIFDVDVYGPSLPTMVEPENDVVTFVGRQIAPLERNGVKLMSFGYVNEGSAVMRGPMVMQLLDQFLSLTYWDELDYLILDLPPGTGDIQLTLSQKINITAAVIVTTPQELSFVDVERGIEMFNEVNIPCVAVVENMAYLDMTDENNQEKEKQKEKETQLKKAFETSLLEKGIASESIDDITKDLLQIVKSSSCKEDEKFRLFGKGHQQRLSNQWGIDQTYSIPLLQKISANGDSGTPFVLDHPNSPQADIYRDLANGVMEEVEALRKAQSYPVISYNTDLNRLEIKEESVNGHVDKDWRSGAIGSRELRLKCRCASCVDELSGKQLLQPSDVSENVRPLKLTPCGNYALSVDWSDGHKSLYPFKQIWSLISDKEEEDGTLFVDAKKQERPLFVEEKKQERPLFVEKKEDDGPLFLDESDMVKEIVEEAKSCTCC